MPSVWQVILTYVPVKDRAVHPYENRFLDGSSKVLPLPAHNAEVVQCPDVAWGGLMAMYG